MTPLPCPCGRGMRAVLRDHAGAPERLADVCKTCSAEAFPADASLVRGPDGKLYSVHACGHEECQAMGATCDVEEVSEPPPRTLPVTPAERCAAGMLRAYVDCTFAADDVADRPDVVSLIDDFEVGASRLGWIAGKPGGRHLTPAGRALLARVEAEDAEYQRAQVVTFLRAEEERYRRNSKDPAHDEPGRERCANKASVLATVAAYIERGDHLAPPIAAPPAKEPR